MENRTEYLLDNYFAHELSKAEAEELSALLQASPELVSEMRFRQQLTRAVQDKSLEGGIKNQDWARAVLPPSAGGPVIKRNMWSRYLYAAAAMVALLVVAWSYLPVNNYEDLIASNTAFYPNKMTFKSLGQESLTVPKEVIQAFALYDQQKFLEAATALETVVNTHPDNVDYRFYWGASLTQSRQYAKAVEVLEPVSQSQNDYRTVSYYYLGLAYAGINEMEKAKASLQRYLDAPDGVTYRKQVMKVLDNLD